MGIPKFFKWLTRRYPMILQSLQIEEDCPPSDNLYLDLNSIVHNSIHGNDSKRHERISKLTDFEEVWADIMRAIDEIVHVVKPRKLILLAVDGVAPRAKMNQQRARRFRSAKDSQELRERLQSQGREVTELFDSNQISPGTQFMHELGNQLQWFVKFKLNTDPVYQNCERVVLSDSSVPGEGEHKMMDYIRNLKLSKDYDPNTRHCFYGSDADLIMLSLLTHEPHFMIIREEHVVKKVKQGGVQRIDISRTNNLQLIHISLLREYFLLEYRKIAPAMKIRFDLERIIDDFIFFCFFIGNDFLPSLSALDIGEGSLDHLINFYKQCLPQMSDYITHEGQIFWDRAEPFIALLGKHEHQVFINRVKTLDQQYSDSKNLITFDENFGKQVGRISSKDKHSIIAKQIQNKVREKKALKCANLFMKNKQKNYKKFLLLKKYSEDIDENIEVSGKNPEVNAKVKNNIEQYLSNLNKYKNIRRLQHEKDNKLLQIDEKDEESLHDILSEIREEFFSDLNPEEIPNSDISDISESEILKEGEEMVKIMESDQNIGNKIDLVQEQNAKYIEKNHVFMTEFVKTYKEDSKEAKRSYYLQKLDFDVKESKGKAQLHKMLFRYLEGMQWVMYYYYRGAPHWRWYYPYHYAPMISDLGSSIVTDFLGGENKITSFRTDTNCNANPKPYTPFQQLLCIFPVRSLAQFLPPEYVKLATEGLKEFFPESFDIDLNGRTLPWEAAILIPFADEDLFIRWESILFEEGMRLTQEEAKRNSISFIFPSYHHDKSKKGRPLKSTLRSMRDLPHDLSQIEFHHDYANVGQFCFQSKLLQGVKIPCPDYPSLSWLGCQDLEWTEKVINRVAFKQSLSKVPQCLEDASGADFEDWVYKFAEGQLKELYIGFPFQREAFPLHFEDPFSIYQLNGDPLTNQWRVTKLRQNKSQEEFQMLCKRISANLSYEKGIHLGDFNTLVTLNAMIGTAYDEQTDSIYKIYEEASQTVPLNLCMKKRSANHYLNINERASTPHGRIQAKQPAICFNSGLLGVMGEVKRKDVRNKTVDISIDIITEENKIHNPFFVENFLKREFAENGLPEKVKIQSNGANTNQQVARRYYGDQEIEVLLGLAPGLVNRLTGTFLIAFDEVGKEERQVVDVGLNIKNFTKKAHVLDYVRFVARESAASNIYDEFQHNQHSRGAHHIRKHWEYSSECVEIIKEYNERFPEILAAIQACSKKNKAMNNLFDVYPDLKKKDKNLAVAQIRKVLEWTENLPVSKLPYVEMGFDALDTSLIQKIQSHNEYVLNNYKKVDLNVKQTEKLAFGHVYQETFPYWSGPFHNKNTVADFKVGNRVMNLKSTMRQYISFGARGTVVGKTESKIIVMFDEQYLHGGSIYGHCEMYRGAQVDPEILLNISREFARLAKDNFLCVKKFQEKPMGGLPAFEDQLAQEHQAQVQINLHKQQNKKITQTNLSQEEIIGTSNDKEETHVHPEIYVKKHETQMGKPRKEEGKVASGSVSQINTGKLNIQRVYQKKEIQSNTLPIFAQGPDSEVEEQKASEIDFKKRKDAEDNNQVQVLNTGLNSDSKRVNPVMILPLGSASEGQLFKPLPGLKILDSSLKNQPQLQKIIQGIAQQQTESTSTEEKGQ